jgi:hypothetical protein
MRPLFLFASWIGVLVVVDASFHNGIYIEAFLRMVSEMAMHFR